MSKVQSVAMEWRARAEDARLLASQLEHPQLKSAALEIAYQYGRMATIAEKLADKQLRGAT